jgi:C_GCAxxG_C_C family probable redox protein
MSTVRAYANLFTMGHCAPAVMRTIGEVCAPGKDWLVRFSAGMPGGIGNTGHECGTVTSPLVLLGLRYGLRDVDDGLPVVFDRSHALSRQFLDSHKTLQCKEIRGKDRFPRHCISPVVHAPELFEAVTAHDGGDAIPRGPGKLTAASTRTWSRTISTALRSSLRACRRAFQSAGT